MKLKLVIGLLLIIASNIVLAYDHEEANTYELKDFSKEYRQALWLKTGDFVFFNLLDKRHAIRMDLVYKDNAKVVLYPEIETAPKGAYAPINKGTYLNVDLNKDDVTDMTIRLTNMQGEDEGLFLFESLVQEEKVPELQGLVVSGESKEKGNKNKLLIAVSIGVLLGLLVIWGVKKQNPDKPKFLNSQTFRNYVF